MADICVPVSTELLAYLSDWSSPVQVKIIDNGSDHDPRYEMIVRIIQDKGDN